jgi:hypothetical protein
VIEFLGWFDDCLKETKEKLNKQAEENRRISDELEAAEKFVSLI